MLHIESGTHGYVVHLGAQYKKMYDMRNTTTTTTRSFDFFFFLIFLVDPSRQRYWLHYRYKVTFDTRGIVAVQYYGKGRKRKEKKKKLRDDASISECRESLVVSLGGKKKIYIYALPNYF